MAEVIFSAVVGELAGRVISLLAGQFRGQERTEAKLRQICHMLVKVHSAIEEARGRQITNYGTLEWLSELNDGLYQGRYLLDTVGCRKQEEIEDDEHAEKVVSHPFSFSLFNPAKRVRVAVYSVKSLLCRHDYVGIDEKIDRVVQILESISGDLKEFLMLLHNCQPIHRPLATNIFVEGQMFGRHVEKERIINFLLHEGGSEKLGVLPIVGCMGVGKTTLAQHVCDDERVRSHFPIIMHSSFLYTLAMARGEPMFFVASKHAVGDAHHFIESVHILKDNYLTKRFLMVFEDVDMRKKQMLEALLPILRRHSKHGSKIIIITSNKGVASIGTVQPINLKAMPHHEYWFFFKAHAFPGRDVEEDPRMLAAGKAIARKLNGSFFGAKIVGAVLKARPDPRFWSKVLRSNIRGLSLLGDGMAYIADLAENLLPSHADMCKLSISKNPFPSQTELARMGDLCQGADCSAGDDIRFEKVLVCRSILPFQRLYYTADCAVRGAENSSKLFRIEGSGRLARIHPSRKGLAHIDV